MGESLYQLVCRHAELVKSREAELGAYPGDGPTAAQASALVESLRPIQEDAEPTTPSILWDAFRQSVEVELSWLFPERDPIGAALTEALRKVQDLAGTALVEALPERKEELERFVSLSLVRNAASRQVALHGNRPNLGLLFARFLNLFRRKGD